MFYLLVMDKMIEIASLLNISVSKHLTATHYTDFCLNSTILPLQTSASSRIAKLVQLRKGLLMIFIVLFL